MNQNQGLIYVGKGAFLENVPARDLSADEVEHFGRDALLKSGLYVSAPQEAEEYVEAEQKPRTYDGRSAKEKK